MHVVTKALVVLARQNAHLLHNVLEWHAQSIKGITLDAHLLGTMSLTQA
jgi:hypothetical protein